MSTITRSLNVFRSAAKPIKAMFGYSPKKGLARQASHMSTESLADLCQGPGGSKRKAVVAQAVDARMTSLQELATWRINAMRHHNQQARQLLKAGDMEGARKALQKSRVSLAYARSLAGDMALLAQASRKQA